MAFYASAVSLRKCLVAELAAVLLNTCCSSVQGSTSLSVRSSLGRLDFLGFVTVCHFRVGCIYRCCSGACILILSVRLLRSSSFLQLPSGAEPTRGCSIAWSPVGLLNGYYTRFCIIHVPRYYTSPFSTEPYNPGSTQFTTTAGFPSFSGLVVETDRPSCRAICTGPVLYHNL
jgi:hypothetical protein